MTIFALMGNEKVVTAMAEYIDREALKNDIAKSTEPFNTGSVFRAINCLSDCRRRCAGGTWAMEGI